MNDESVSLLSSGPPSTILDPEPDAALAALQQALASRRQVSRALAAVCIRWPRCLEAWARLGETSSDPAVAYACFRTGYHRGLDRLRANGWRGSGYVRWQHPTNRGFLRALAGLARLADEIGEADEAARCALFLRQLDPSWPPSDYASYQT